MTELTLSIEAELVNAKAELDASRVMKHARGSRQSNLIAADCWHVRDIGWQGSEEF